MGHYQCTDCAYSTIFEGGAASHSKEKKHYVQETDDPPSDRKVKKQ